MSRIEMGPIEHARAEALATARRGAVGSAVIVREIGTGILSAVPLDRDGGGSGVPAGFEFVERVFLPGEQDRIRTEMRAKGWSERTIERHLDPERY